MSKALCHNGNTLGLKKKKKNPKFQLASSIACSWYRIGIIFVHICLFVLITVLIKQVVEFAFRGQYENCSNGIKCGSILNWLGVEAYPVYDNFPISEDDKKDPTKLLDVFKCYFKLERNIFQSWYALGSIYSGAYKTQSKFYHKLNSVANDCNFTNKDEIVKFLYLTHNQNTRVHEHLLKELTDATGLAHMFRMARVCEGTVHSEEISKQYLE